MFEDLKVSEWWFVGLAALTGYFVVKHFVDKLPGRPADSSPGAQSEAKPRPNNHGSQSGGFEGFQKNQMPGEEPNWFRRDEEEAARQAQHDASSKAALAATAPTSKPWYQVLEVSSVAHIDDIKQAYKRKIRMYHPDKVSGLGPEFTLIAEAKAQEINDAYRQACASRGR